MNPITLIVIAIGLAMDAFAVSVTEGAAMRGQGFGLGMAVKIAAFFGGFQAFMPVIGWMGGRGFSRIVSSWDHWLVFVLLTIIGGKMMYESVKLREIESGAKATGLLALLGLSLATSIDALAVGVSFAFLRIPIATPVVTIGFVTFVLSLAGVILGDRLSNIFGAKFEFVGGLFLIAMGVRILLQHLGYLA